MMNAFATSISIGLQYGVPLETFVRKFSYMRFDPEGITTNPEIPFAKSLPDYIMRWLASRFLDPDVHEELGILTEEVRARKMAEDVGGSGNGNGNGHGNGHSGNGHSSEGDADATAGGATAEATPPTEALTDKPSRCLCEDRGPRPRPGLLAVRRHDAAHGHCYTCSSCGNNTGCG